MNHQEKFQDVRGVLLKSARDEYDREWEQLASKYQAFFLDAEIKGIHFNYDALANIAAMREKAEQKLSDALEIRVNEIRDMEKYESTR
jgi:hypothetical protein